jgi:hypothetical protein
MGVIVIAMIVVVMIVSIITTVRMPVIVTKSRVMVRGMGMPVGVSPAFRVERRLDFDDARAEPAHHVFDHMIAPDTQALRRDLRRQMPVAEVPGDAHQMMRILAADFRQWLGRSHDLDQPPILQHKRIAAAQRGRRFQIEQKFNPTRPGHREPPAMPVVETQHDGIRRRLRPAMLRLHFRRADHGRMHL